MKRKRSALSSESNPAAHHKIRVAVLRAGQKCWICPPKRGENYVAPPKHGAQKPKYKTRNRKP